MWTALVCGSFLLLLGSGYKEKYTAAERLIWVLAALVFVFIIHELAHLMRLNDARQGKCIFLATEYEGNAAEYGTRSGSASVFMRAAAVPGGCTQSASVFSTGAASGTENIRVESTARA